MENYHSIKPIKAFINSPQILEMSLTTDFLPCTIIGLSIYKDETITFIIKLEDGEVFSYIPIHSLVTKKNELLYKNNDLDLKDLAFTNAPSYEISVNYLESLNGEVTTYFKNKDLWVPGSYILTIDFYTENELLNLVKLNDGKLAMIPFHKMKFKSFDSTEKSFVKYLKQRNTYKI